jgi:hypothetical protein
MMPASVLSVLISTILLIILGRHDPKRLRNRSREIAPGSSTAALPKGIRRLLGWLALAPGLALLVIEQWWAFLIWMGTSCAIGWITTHLLSSVVARHPRLHKDDGTTT